MKENLWVITIGTLGQGQCHLVKTARSRVTLCGARVGTGSDDRQQLSDYDSVETVGHWSGWCATCKDKLPPAMITTKKIIADRQQFIDCVNGDLMTRNAAGEVTQLGDAATLAVEAAERGETVWLTVDGRIVSKIENGQEVEVLA